MCRGKLFNKNYLALTSTSGSCHHIFPLEKHFGFGSLFREHHSKLMFHLKNLFIFLSFSIKCLGKKQEENTKPPKRLSPPTKAKGWHYRNERFAVLMETTAAVELCRRSPAWPVQQENPRHGWGFPGNHWDNDLL